MKAATIAAGVFLLAIATPARAELTTQGWLDFYDGKAGPSVVVAQLMAESYVLGMAASVIALRILSCRDGYLPKAEDIARLTARVLRDNLSHPGMSVTAAVLAAATIDGTCQRGERGAR